MSTGQVWPSRSKSQSAGEYAAQPRGQQEEPVNAERQEAAAEQQLGSDKQAATGTVPSAHLSPFLVTSALPLSKQRKPLAPAIEPLAVDAVSPDVTESEDRGSSIVDRNSRENSASSDPLSAIFVLQGVGAFDLLGHVWRRKRRRVED
jgi:hypothetical protein